MGTDKFFFNSKIQRLIGNNIMVKKIRKTRRQEPERAYSYLRTHRDFPSPAGMHPQTTIHPSNPTSPGTRKWQSSVLKDDQFCLAKPLPYPQRKKNGEGPGRCVWGETNDHFQSHGVPSKKLMIVPTQLKQCSL